MNQCPARGRECKNCGKKNYFSSVCRSKKVQVVTSSADVPEESATDYDFFIDAVHSDSNKNQAFVDIKSGNNDTVKFKIDTGAQVNTLTKSCLNELNAKFTINKTDLTLHSYGGTTLKTVDKCNIPCTYKDTKQKLSFYIVDECVYPVIGLQSSIDLNLIKLILSVESPIVDQHNHIINTGDPEIIKPVNKGTTKDDLSFMVNTGDKEIDKLILEFSDIF